MKDMSINQVLQQMQVLKAQAQGSALRGIESATSVNPATQVGKAEGPGFSNVLKDALEGVNRMQQHSANLVSAFEHGDPDVSLADVMVASQKSSLSFQALTQVRNRVVSAYQDVMNMPL